MKPDSKKLHEDKKDFFQLLIPVNYLFLHPGNSIGKMKAKGTVFGIVSAVSYGINPLCALLLYEVGVNVDSVLFYRYVLAAVILGLMMMAKGISFRVNKTELASLAVLGVLFAISSLSLFSSFHYMDAGIASTILFVYPVMVAVIMAVFFKEKVSLLVVFSILLAFTGIALLCQGDGGHALSMIGILLVMLSSLTYAVYIVTVNRSVLKTMSPIKLTFYVLLFCALTIIVHSDFGSGLQMLTTPYMWGIAITLAIIPTVISLVTMALSVHYIGSTPTAILGALEPVTAVTIGVTVFGEHLTPRLIVGMFLVIVAVTLIVVGKSVQQLVLRRVFHRY